MNSTRHITRWWQCEIDGPVTSTLVCCAAITVIVGTVGFIADGFSLALFLAPLGIFSGASVALCFSKHATMCKWRNISNRIIGRIGRVLFLYGLPLWVYIAIKHGIGFTIVMMGGISALIVLGIGGTLALLVTFTHVILSVHHVFIRKGN